MTGDIAPTERLGVPGGTGTRERGGRKRGARVTWLLGPALVASIAYLDPGNVASNMTAGATFGYLLVWVVVFANLMAWLIQYLSAKLGVTTGLSLPEHLGARIRRPWLRRAYWAQAEIVAMATDIAEVIGGAVALNLLFTVPLVVGGAVTGAVSLALLAVHNTRGAKTFELVMMGLIAVISFGFVYGVWIAPPDGGAILGGLVPRLTDANSVLLTASILGATIMPHAIYAHSALARDRFVDIPQQPGAAGGAPGSVTTVNADRLLRATRWDVFIGLGIAGTVNLCILLLAAANLPGVAGTDTLAGAYHALSVGLGGVVGTVFAVGLLASGLASTSVGAYAGAEIMHGLLRVRVPLVVRRLVSLAPALLLLASGFDPTQALVLSQVVLSFGIPFALIPLVRLTARHEIMGRWRNHWVTTTAGIAASVFLIGLNVVLVVLSFNSPA